MKTFTVEQVAEHNTAKDCWIIVEGKVFDVTQFLTEHPGGKKVLVKVAGKDASKQFKNFHNDAIMQRVGLPMQIGVIGDATQKDTPAAPAQPAAPKKTTEPKPAYTIAGYLAGTESKYGEGIPYGDPSWYQEWNR